MNENLEETITKKLDELFLDPDKVGYLHPSSGFGYSQDRGRSEGNYAEIFQDKVLISLTLKGEDAETKMLDTIEKAIQLIKKVQDVANHDLSHPLFEKKLEARFKHLYHGGKIQQ